MNFFQKMERKYGRYAVPGLTNYIIVTYVIGYILYAFNPGWLEYITLEPGLILRGQIWRLVSWVLIPPGSLDIFTIITLLFYYSIGMNLERTWGGFRYNVYIFGGLIFTIIGAFVCYAIAKAGLPAGSIPLIGGAFSTYYVSMSIYLAFALTYPDMQVLLYFVIPVKMKWMGFIYTAFIVYDCIQMTWVGRVAVIASLLNFMVFFLMTRNYRKVSPKEIKRKKEFQRALQQSMPGPGQTRHKCAVCGRTELDDPDLEFRYCSKCDGNYEYCQDHLFTHEHVK